MSNCSGHGRDNTVQPSPLLPTKLIACYEACTVEYPGVPDEFFAMFLSLVLLELPYNKKGKICPDNPVGCQFTTFRPSESAIFHNLGRDELIRLG